jgi:hypothetical protein
VQDILPPLLMVVGVVMLGLILTMSIRGKIARRNAEQPTARERIDQLKARAGGGGGDDGRAASGIPSRSRGTGREDLHAARAELLDTAQRLAAQLDNKAEQLEQLIRQADERLAALEFACHEPPAILEAPQRTTREARAGSERSDTSGHESVRAPEPEPADPLTAAVYELADRGSSPVDIARELDEQVGKVELILALRSAR